MKQFKVECKTHEIATNLTAFLNLIPNVKAEESVGIVYITFEEPIEEPIEEEEIDT